MKYSSNLKKLVREKCRYIVHKDWKREAFKLKKPRTVKFHFITLKGASDQIKSEWGHEPQQAYVCTFLETQKYYRPIYKSKPAWRVP
jgi:hypothetical protein